jgi:hypothetical protein
MLSIIRLPLNDLIGKVPCIWGRDALNNAHGSLFDPCIIRSEDDMDLAGGGSGGFLGRGHNGRMFEPERASEQVIVCTGLHPS